MKVIIDQGPKKPLLIPKRLDVIYAPERKEYFLLAHLGDAFRLVKIAEAADPGMHAKHPIGEIPVSFYSSTTEGLPSALSIYLGPYEIVDAEMTLKHLEGRD